MCKLSKRQIVRSDVFCLKAGTVTRHLEEDKIQTSGLQ
jgi:hypothetical protein